MLQVLALVWGDGALSRRDREHSAHSLISRFFETEGIAIMVMLVSKYSIKIKDEPEFAGETFEERYARVTASSEKLTTT
jgi:hypothetical protein